jgi:signal transduction histidine kinase
MDLAWLAGRLPRSNGQMLKRIRSTQQLADSLIQTIRRISTELKAGRNINCPQMVVYLS